ncbi:MAG: cardiolipin synthase [Gemmataceae bacterium]
MDFTSGGTWAFLYLASEWVIRIIMVVVVPFRRSPEAAKGWLLLVFFLPLPALVLYWLIGRPTFPAWRHERFTRLPDAFAGVRARLADDLRRERPDLPANLAQAATLAQNLGHLAPLRGNTVELLPEYDASIDRLVADIDQARDHAHLLYYIFADDATAQKVIDALGRAVARGVTCRVLLDALGSRHWAKSTLAKLAAVGVAAHRVLPVAFFRRHSARADLRNHRKIAVIDGRVGYTGSQNLVYSAFKPGITYQEMVVRVTGPVVLELQAVFAGDWFMETEEALTGADLFPPPEDAGPVIAQLLPSGPDYPTTSVQRLIVALIHGARERVVLTTPYFIPDDALIQALETAVLRGVEVHLTVSKIADQLLVSLAQRSYYTQLLNCGVKIHLFRDKFLHAKHLSIDGALCLIGSSNLDMRSFTLNAEASLLVYDAGVTARLRAEQERNWSNCDLLVLETWEKRRLASKVCENLARLVGPLL